MPASTEPLAQRFSVPIPRGGTEEPRLEPALLVWGVCRCIAARTPRAVRIELFAEPCAEHLAIDVRGFTHALGRVLTQAVEALGGRTGWIEIHARELADPSAEVVVHVCSDATPVGPS